MLSSSSSAEAPRRHADHKCYSRRDDPSLSLFPFLSFARYFCFKSLNCLTVYHQRVVLPPLRHSAYRSILYRKNIPWIGYGTSWKFVALNKLLVLSFSLPFSRREIRLSLSPSLNGDEFFSFSFYTFLLLIRNYAIIYIIEDCYNLFTSNNPSCSVK